MRLINKHKIKEVGWGSRYNPIPRANTWYCGNDDVVLPQILPRLIGTYGAFGRENSWACKFARQSIYLPKINQGTEVLSDLLTNESAGCEHEHAFRS